MIADILKKVHRKFAKDTDYPEAGSEDLLTRIDHVDDAISEWEDLVDEGYSWKELMTTTQLVLSGTGTDPLPTDFRAFIRSFNMQGDGFQMATLIINGSEWNEVNASEGERMAQAGFSPNIFWDASGNFRSLPAMTGTITLPYLRKATRYTTGSETDEPEMSNPKFIEDYVTAMIFDDNSDDNKYESNMLAANEKLKKMKYKAMI